MRSFLKSIFTIILLALCACSNRVPTKDQVTEAMKKIMPPNFEVISVAPLKEIPGLIEVSVKMEKQPLVLYMDRKCNMLYLVVF